MTKQEILNVVNNESVKNGQFFSVLYVGCPSNMRKTNNPYVGRVMKATLVSGIQFGVSYTNKLNNEREREGLVPDFVSHPMRGCEWVEGYANQICEAVKDGSWKLRITLTENVKFESKWMIDGRAATAEEVAEIKSFIPERTELPLVMNIGIEKIACCKVGGQIFQADQQQAPVLAMA